MTSPSFNEQQGIELNDQWWGAHVRDSGAEELLCSLVRRSVQTLYRTQGDEGWTFVLIQAPEDQKVREELLFDQDGLIVQTRGLVYGPWINPTGAIAASSTKPSATQTDAAPPAEAVERNAPSSRLTQDPSCTPSRGAIEKPSIVLEPNRSYGELGLAKPAQPSGSPGEGEGGDQAAADGEDDDRSADGRRRRARRAPRSLVKPPEGMDFAGLNIELDGDAVWIRLTFPDGEGPATRLHPKDTPLGRVIRETIANKTKEPLTVTDDVGIARETQAAMTSRWEDGTPIPPVFTNGFFWKYDHESGVWIKISSEDMKRLVNEAWWRHPCFKASKRGDDDEDQGPSGKIYPMSLSVGKISAIVEMIGLECARPTFFSDRSETRGGVAFLNGYATVENGKVVLLPKSPRNRAEFILPFNYDESLPCPRWLHFLDEAMEPGPRQLMSDSEKAEEREKKKALLGEFAGVCLLGNATEHQRCLVMDGRGGNGKSVVTEILQNLFAGDSISNVAPHDWVKPFSLAILAGKRMNIASELPERDMVEGHIFKGVIAGDSLTVENKYEKPFTTKMTAGHIFAANELPHSRDLSDGFWRRFMVLSLEQRFDNRPNVDTKLSAKIVAEEIGGVAAWCLRHAAEMEARGGKFTAPSTSVARKEEWKKQSNPLEMFLEEVTSLAPSNNVTAENAPSINAAAFYEVYSEWTKKRGHGLMSETKFGTKIKVLLESIAQSRGISLSWAKGRRSTVYYVSIHPDWKYVIERNMRDR